MQKVESQDDAVADHILRFSVVLLESILLAYSWDNPERIVDRYLRNTFHSSSVHVLVMGRSEDLEEVENYEAIVMVVVQLHFLSSSFELERIYHIC